MSAKTISRFTVPELKELPEDIRERILAVRADHPEAEAKKQILP